MGSIVLRHVNIAGIRKTIGLIAAASGLFAAACITGLPTATCYVMADAYITAVKWLLWATSVAGGVYGLISIDADLELVIDDRRLSGKSVTVLEIGVFTYRFLLACGVALALYVAAAAAGQGIANLEIAAAYCLPRSAPAGQGQGADQNLGTRLYRSPFSYRQRS